MITAKMPIPILHLFLLNKKVPKTAKDNAVLPDGKEKEVGFLTITSRL